MNTKETENQYIMNTYARYDLTLVSGKNATCYDENGKKYIDLGSGIGVNSLGYCDDSWCDAVINQAKTLQHASNYYYTSPMARLAEKLCTETGYSKVFFGNSGAEANEGAIKLARKYSFDKYNKDGNFTRNKIITLVNSFHGRTVTTLSATGQGVFHNYFFPFTDGFDYAIANDTDSLLSKIDDTVCAIMIEFIQGEGGVIPLENDFVQQVKKICDEKDILLIADEVQTGMGRTGKLLTSEHYNVKPDITTLAKGLGGGLPIGAFLANDKLKNTMGASSHGTTFGGNPVVCAGALAVLKKVANDDFLNEVTKKAEYIKAKLNDIEEIENITGIGLMMGLKLKTKKAIDVVKSCINDGCMPLTAKDKVRLLPPLTITYDELDIALDILKTNLK